MAGAVSWKQLLINALESNSNLKHSSFLQLATVGSNGRPANRTVVFRGFLDDTHKIQINTDSRSRKVFHLGIEDLRHCPFGEICWYFTDTWEQFRINGKIDIIDDTVLDPIKLQQRDKAWFASSLKSKLQYLGPKPGIPCFSEEPPPQQFSLDPSTGPVSAFCLLVLDPDQVDYVNLKTNDRLAFTSQTSVNGEKCWNTERINP
ncbi:Pyridoxamine 5'-phosphate oxidase, Alr4036 family, FMN-binding domain [Dillenia turbinata]|uniref:pyridoxal 5'-phosphate synthase n=1 Tax=Dillenia turbinata TaxID=194707 RepID=A0AAN8UZ90_9MAGN